MRLLGRRVLIKRVVNTLDKIGSIVIPQRSKTLSQEGEVIAVGMEVDTVKVGEHVLFGRHAGTAVEHGGESYVMLWREDVMAVLE